MPWRGVIFLAIVLLLLAGCAAASPPVLTVLSTLTLTPTEGPIIMCTAPACWEDEVYSCQGKCPGGCGTFCATRTPDPQASPTPTIPLFASICALPTLAPGTPIPSMDVCASSDSVRVGDTLQVAVRITGVTYMDFVLITGKNVNRSGDFSVRARTGGHFSIPIYGGASLNPVRVQSEDYRIFLLLKAISAGPIEISFQLVPTFPDLRATLSLTVLP